MNWYNITLIDGELISEYYNKRNIEYRYWLADQFVITSIVQYMEINDEIISIHLN